MFILNIIWNYLSILITVFYNIDNQYHPFKTEGVLGKTVEKAFNDVKKSFGRLKCRCKHYSSNCLQILQFVANFFAVDRKNAAWGKSGA